MKPLTDMEHWNSLYDPRAASAAPGATNRLKTAMKRLLGPTVLEYMRDYRDYLLWDVTYPRFLDAKRGAKALEVGSAPGYHLIRLRDAFGFEPYGVEYSPSGAELNRRLFQLRGISSDHVIQADFLSTDFQSRYEAHFDVVVSHGFIEHFTGVEIMRRATFCELFSRREVTPLLCDYYGTFSFGLFNTRPESRMRYLLMVCDKVQRLLDAAFRLLFGARGAKSRHLSPYLIFVGVKER